MDATATPRGISLAVGELGARGRPINAPPSVGVLPCREPLNQTLSLLLANRHGRFEIAGFHYEN